MSFVEVETKKEILKKKKFSKQFVTTEPTNYGLRKKTFWWMSFVEDRQKKRNVEKEKKIFCKQFVRIKRNLNEIWFKV